MGNEVCRLLPAPLMAVVTQSACTLCPLQTLPQPLVSNTLQVPSSFKQSPHDTFVIASCLIREPFTKMAELFTRRVFDCAAHVQTETNMDTDTRIISVSLPAAWLIDCGCSDTLCRIGILPLIGADTNSSRTAGDRGKQRQHWQMTWMAGAARCGEKPHRCHSAFSLGHVYIVYAPFQRWQSADVWHTWCKSHLTIALKEGMGLTDYSEWWVERCTSETIMVIRSPACCRASLWLTFSQLYTQTGLQPERHIKKQTFLAAAFAGNFNKWRAFTHPRSFTVTKKYSMSDSTSVLWSRWITLLRENVDPLD